MSDEEHSHSSVPGPPSASVNIGRDYDIIDEEAVLSRSPNYRSVTRTGQVIPLALPESDKELDISEELDGGQDFDNNEATFNRGAGQPGSSDQMTSGMSELNPFANISRKLQAGSGDAGASSKLTKDHKDQADDLNIRPIAGDLTEVEGMVPVEQFSNLPALPRVNCPEKIIICLDLSSEVNRVPFVSRDFTKYHPLDLIKRALNIFVKTKSKMNPLHEYALVIFQDSATWMQDFTSDVDDFVNVLLDLTSETRDTEVCDLTTLFETILRKVDLPFVEDSFVLPPPYIVRVMFVYGRSNCVPEFCDGNEAQKTLASSPYFFFDVFYVHEPPSAENLCKEVYDVFLELDSNNTSYIHEVGRNTTHLHNKMAMLLGHPLQRPIQMQAAHSLNLSEA